MALKPDPVDFIVHHGEPSKAAMVTAALIHPEMNWHDLYPTARIIDELLFYYVTTDGCGFDQDLECESCDLAYTQNEVDDALISILENRINHG